MTFVPIFRPTLSDSVRRAAGPCSDGSNRGEASRADTFGTEDSINGNGGTGASFERQDVGQADSRTSRCRGDVVQRPEDGDQ